MSSNVKLLLESKQRSLGAFSVRRVLPSHKQRMVGPFIFFDHMGPADFAPGTSVDVRPHPHVCLATITYLFEGGLLHRDTVGTEIEIRPGAANWMTAGKGISHSERSPDDLIKSGQTLHGIQTWVALPKSHEEVDPRFDHHPADTLPEKLINGINTRVIAGSAYEMTSPVDYPHPIIYVAYDAISEGRVDLPDFEERCLYVVTGEMTFDGQIYTEGQMIILEAGPMPAISLTADTKVMLAGGAPMDGPRYIEWNFVASDKDRIEQAKADWRASIAGGWIDTPFTMPPNEHEYIPLPGDPEAEPQPGS